MPAAAPLPSCQVLSASTKPRLAGRQPPARWGAPGDNLVPLPAVQAQNPAAGGGWGDTFVSTTAHLTSPATTCRARMCAARMCCMSMCLPGALV
jgi:hypothetical protein